LAGSVDNLKPPLVGQLYGDGNTHTICDMESLLSTPSTTRLLVLSQLTGKEADKHDGCMDRITVSLSIAHANARLSSNAIFYSDMEVHAMVSNRVDVDHSGVYQLGESSFRHWLGTFFQTTSMRRLS